MSRTTSILVAKLRLLRVAGVVLACASAGCGSSATTSLSPSGVPKCKVAVTPSQLTVEGAGGAGAMTVSGEAECAWTASAAASWISALTPPSGQGNGEVKFQVAPNPAGTPRQADISLNDTVAKVTQAGAPCTIGLAPERETVGVEGGSGTVTVTTLSGCAWTVSSNASWLTASPAQGAGPGTVSFSASANTGAARVGHLTIGGRTFAVTQQAVGAPPPPPPQPQCTYAIQPASATIGAQGGSLTVGVKTGLGCPWTATSNASWLTVGGSGTGSGSGSLTIAVVANPGAARSGVVTIANQTLTVTQAAAGAPPPACTYAIDPVAQSVAAAAGPASVAVQTAAGCAWTATTTTPWLKISAGGSGTGAGAVAFLVAENTGPARSGTISIAGLTHTVNQASGCAVSIDPSSAAFSSSGGAGAPIAVTAAAGCAWTAATAADWIDLTAGTSGTGNGEVAYTVEPNTGAARQGAITIGTSTFTVSQAAPCSYSIDPTSATFSRSPATSGPVSVTAPAGCAWTAAANDSWITVTSGAAGTANGTVTFDVSANDGASTRVGTLTIAGHTFTVTQTTE